MDEFVKVLSARQPDICSQLDTLRASQIQQNHQKIKSMVETINLCGRQNISLRGHRDSLLDLKHDDTANPGNLWVLLNFHVEAGDLIFFSSS